MNLALFAAAILGAAWLLLRRRARIRFLGISAGVWGIFGYLAVVARAFALRVDLPLAVVSFCVVTAALFWIVVASCREDEVSWSAGRAAVAAALFYIAAMPRMMVTPPDGDEPYYILMTESIARDGDLDLRNQYRDLAHSVTQRNAENLRPQPGDPVGPNGEIYSHHEPFLPLLLLPGYLVAGLPGMLMTMALFGTLLARSTVRLIEEEGADDRTIRAIFPLFALGPPIVFYALRIWPEVPAAWAFVETLRGIRARRPARWVPAILGLVLLKLRFLLIAVVLLVRAVRRPRHMAIAAAIVAVPLALAWIASGSPLNVHTIGEWLPGDIHAMPKGFFGLLADGAQGIAFQAPIYLFGVIAIARWRAMPAGFRLGVAAAALYVLYLIPRAEWHGGWSPPLRYIVVFMPVLALGCAALWKRIDPGAVAVVAAWSAALVAHGMRYPWRLFHIANGENFVGETLSTIWQSDFSRLFPSFIRVNAAAYVASAVVVLAIVWFRRGWMASPLVVGALLAAAFWFGRRPGNRIEFEDAHVAHRGGALYPYVWQVQRFLYRGGWIVHAGESMSFLARGGRSIVQYQAAQPASVQIGARAYDLPATGNAYGMLPVQIDADGRVQLQCLAGAVNLDRMDHE